MAASKAPRRNRTKPTDPAFEKTRQKIRVSQILNRLEKHILGEQDTKRKVVKMSASQVTAALGLLKKVMPDLQSTEIKGEVTATSWIGPPPKTADEWEEEHGETRH